MSSEPPSRLMLLAAVGTALSGWSQVETGLSILFFSISRIPDQERAGAAFDAIIAFETRLSVCDALMKHDVTDALEQEMWNRVSARMRKFYKKRHEVAHFSIPFYQEAGDVIAPFFTWDQHRRGAVRYLTTAQIMERSEKFSEIAAAIGWFAELARKRKFPSATNPPQDSEEPPLIPRLRETASQILAERERTPRPVGE